MAFSTVSEGFEALTAHHEVIFPPRGRDFTQEEIAERIGDCDVLCSVFDIPIGRDLIDKGRSLKLIANYAVGYNNIDVAYAASKGIVVTNTPRAVIEPTADLALALLLSCTRRIAEWDRLFRHDGANVERGRLCRLGVNLYGKTLGVLGFGNIGAAVARRCQAFGMDVLYNKRTRLSEVEEKALGVTFAKKDDLIRQADVVTLHTPLTPETRHLIGATELAAMKPTAILINTARGAVVDEQALVQALQEKRIAAAGLDVFENNDVPSPELFTMDNVSLTPHVGTQTYDSRVDMVHELCDNVLGFLQGDRPISRVN
ncbi:lactate dehydrogenase-like 2-hydroxyacid dehydrogenase [Porphyromonas loveana]|uniref:Lactate dehydrogenase-like 2-hydroxyacid dehydrogenase n=2 Tax=Porphyromonas loveana TaxID=1884669 RepID=A0A2U1F847_9PORP|nr:lactate dehydrogenase-like 2-hydroxyacid dehydrogenase [Porphyromonas loveana]